MKILYVMPSILHPTVRGELRHYHFLKRLAREHEITLIVLNRKDVSRQALDEMQQCTRALVRVGEPSPVRPSGPGITGVMAGLQWRFHKTKLFRRGLADMKQCVERRLRCEKFDVLLLAGSDLYPIAERVPDAPIVFDWCDTDSIRLRRALRHATLFEWPWRFLRYQQIRRVEQRLFRKLRHVTFISRRDRDAAPEAARTGTVIPNGCDLTYWERRGSVRGDCIVFTGVLDYLPNEDAARYLLTTIAPLVRRHIPNLEVVIAGRNPSRDVLALAQTCGRAVVTGTVPDLRPYLENAAVFVAPLRFASGMQNKIIEAMAMELPVVTTPVAAEGFSADDREDPPLLVADDPCDLATHIVNVVRDPLKAQRLGVEGRRYVHRHCDWERSARMLERLCREVALIQRTRTRVRAIDFRHRAPHSARSRDRVFHSIV